MRGSETSIQPETRRPSPTKSRAKSTTNRTGSKKQNTKEKNRSESLERGVPHGPREEKLGEDSGSHLNRRRSTNGPDSCEHRK